MSEFYIYLLLGLGHILNVKAIDHILFIVALCTSYDPSQWKKILVLVTAFTIGHSLTLALSTLEVFAINTNLIEFLIPLTILCSALSNVFLKNDVSKNNTITFDYLYALGFGLIHGMGFSNFLKSILGKNVSIIKQLLAFNVGLEVGQLVILSLFLGIGIVFLNIIKINKREWIVFISAAIAVEAIHIMLENIY